MLFAIPSHIALVYSGRHKPGRKNISRLELYDLDSQRIATGYASGTIMLWDLEDNSLRCELTDHRQEITDLLFTRDGKTLVSSSSAEVRIWASEGLTWWPAKPQGSDAREISEPSRE